MGNLYVPNGSHLRQGGRFDRESLVKAIVSNLFIRCERRSIASNPIIVLIYWNVLKPQ